MGQKLTRNESITSEDYFVQYIHDAKARAGRTNHVSDGYARLRDHLLNYGHGLLGSRDSAEQLLREEYDE